MSSLPVSWRAGLFATWVFGALLLVYLPTIATLHRTLWQDPAHAQGPLVLAVASFVFATRLRAHWSDPSLALEPAPALGWPVLALGALMYALGRSQDFVALEVLSLVPVLLGCTLVLLGPAVARRMWFAFVFVLFLVPVPGSIIDAITQPMKLAVSQAAESVLHLAGYPVARAGVALHIGPYQLLVADACAGLNSLFVLEAMGLLYLNVVTHASMFRNVAMAIAVLPVSFVANVMRVLVLAGVTFHFGDEAGQGFVHQFSGLVLFAGALLLLVAADGALRSLIALRRVPSLGFVARPAA